MRRIFLSVLCGITLSCFIQDDSTAFSGSISLYNSYELVDLTTNTPLSSSTTDEYKIEILWAGNTKIIDPLTSSNVTSIDDDESLSELVTTTLYPLSSSLPPLCYTFAENNIVYILINSTSHSNKGYAYALT